MLRPSFSLLCVMSTFVCGTAKADPILFELENLGGITGNTATASRMANIDGVTFTANLQITGSDDLNANGNGIGVDGLINGSEHVQFSLTISDVSGGSVVFNTFDRLNLDSFEGPESDPERAAISADNIFDNAGDQIVDGFAGGTSDNFAITNTRVNFFVVSNGDASNTFRVREVRADFTVTAVPEPMSGLLLSALATGVFFRRRQRSG